MDQITITALPHPVTTFILGFLLLAITLLWNEYRRTRSDLNTVTKQLLRLEDQIRTQNEKLDASIAEVSKKIDSRVDKAIINFKKMQK